MKNSGADDTYTFDVTEIAIGIQSGLYKGFILERTTMAYDDLEEYRAMYISSLEATGFEPKFTIYTSTC